MISNVINRQMKTCYVRNTAKAGAICEDVDGVPTMIPAGRVGLIDEERCVPLGKLVEKVDKKVFDAQEAADAKAAKEKGGG